MDQFSETSTSCPVTRAELQQRPFDGVDSIPLRRRRGFGEQEEFGRSDQAVHVDDESLPEFGHLVGEDFGEFPARRFLAVVDQPGSEGARCVWGTSLNCGAATRVVRLARCPMRRRPRTSWLAACRPSAIRSGRPQRTGSCHRHSYGERQWCGDRAATSAIH